MNTVTIHQSLHRHSLVLGAERELAMFSALIAFLVGVGGMTGISAASAAVFWIAAVFVLRLMAKADPMMSKVWMRHLRQQGFYSARSSRWRRQGGFRC